MADDIKFFLTLLMGASLPLVGQYFIEYFKLKHERLKFSFEKIITVGEEFYRFSGLTLFRFEATLNVLESIDQYNSPDAFKVFADVESNMIDLCKNIASSTITITTANIYYKVSNVQIASDAAAKITKAMADFHEIEKTDSKINNDKRKQALEEVKNQVKSFIQIIKTDRQQIEEKIKKLMSIPKH